MKRYALFVGLLALASQALVAAVPLIQDISWDCVRPIYVIAGDFNGDGWDDFALACHSCDVILAGLNPTGNPCPVPWPAPKAFKLPDSPVALGWGLFGSGVGPYYRQIVGITQYTPGWTQFKVTDPSASLRKLPLITATHVAVGDFNGDASPDVAVLDSLGLSVFFPTGGIPSVSLPGNVAAGEPAFIASGDFDRDGDLDMVISSGTSLLFFENTGGGTFTFKLSIPVGLSLRAIAVADFDGDADEDLAVVDPKFSALAIMRNNGCWKFTITKRIKMDLGPVFLVAFDCDRDGDQDLAVARYDGNVVTILYNNGTGGFEVQHTYKVGKNPIGLAVGDFDRNGILDLVVALHGGGPAGSGPVAQIIYNPCCAPNDCGGVPCCGEEQPPAPCGSGS